MNRTDLPCSAPRPAAFRAGGRGLAAGLLLLAAGSAAPLAYAATCTWLGAAPNSTWSSSGNWDGCGGAHPVPQDGDLVLFPAIAGNRINVNDLADLELARIMISGSSYVITGNAIALNGDLVATVALGGSNEVDPVVGLGLVVAGSGHEVQCLGTRGVTLTGPVDLAGSGLGFDAVCPIRVQGTTSGAGGLTKAGTGRLILSAANTYTGTTTVNAGTLTLQHQQGLGANGTQTLQNGISTAPGATLELDASLVVVDEPLTLNGLGVGGGGALRTTSGSSVWTGTVRLASDTAVGTDPGSRLTLSGVVADESSGNASITKVGTGTLEFSGANTYRGTTTINEGVLVLSSNTALGLTGASSGTTVLDGAQLWLQTPLVTDEALILNGAGVGGSGALRNVSGNNTWTGPILLATDATIASDNAGEQLVLSGTTSGSAGITKTGAGTLVLSGANTYTGVTQVAVGVLLGNGDGSFGASGAGSGTTVADGAALQLQGSITVASESLTLNGAGINGSGALRNLSGANTWGGPIVLVSDATIDSGAVGQPLTLAGPIGGAAGLTKVGAGTLTLSGSNSYTGVTTVANGTLRLQSSGGLGTGGAGGGGTTIANGAALQLEGAIVVANETLSLSGTGIAGTGALHSTAGNNQWNGAIVLASDSAIAAADGSTLTMGGNTGGSGELTKVGTGTLVFPNSNSYTGTTTIQQGVLSIASGGALGTVAAGTVVADGAQLQLQGSMAVNEPLVLNGLGVDDSGALHATGTTFTVTLSGPVTFAAPGSRIGVDAGGTMTLAAPAGGIGGLQKVGAGTLTLAGNNTYTGTTTVSGGVLLLTGAMNAVTVDAGGTFGGNGSAGAITLDDGGLVAPVGTLSADSLLWHGGGGVELQIGGIGGGGDRLQLAGAMQKGSGSGQFYRLFGDVNGDGVVDAEPGITYVLTTYGSTTFAAADLGFDYGGPRGSAMTGTFTVTLSQAAFVPLAVSLFRDSFED